MAKKWRCYFMTKTLCLKISTEYFIFLFLKQIITPLKAPYSPPVTQLLQTNVIIIWNLSKLALYRSFNLYSSLGEGNACELGIEFTFGRIFTIPPQYWKNWILSPSRQTLLVRKKLSNIFRLAFVQGNPTPTKTALVTPWAALQQTHSLAGVQCCLMTPSMRKK